MSPPASKRDSGGESELALTKRRSNYSETPQEADAHVNATATAFTSLQTLAVNEASPFLGEITNSEQLVRPDAELTERVSRRLF